MKLGHVTKKGNCEVFHGLTVCDIHSLNDCIPDALREHVIGSANMHDAG